MEFEGSGEQIFNAGFDHAMKVSWILFQVMMKRTSRDGRAWANYLISLHTEIEPELEKKEKEGLENMMIEVFQQLKSLETQEKARNILITPELFKVCFIFERKMRHTKIVRNVQTPKRDMDSRAFV